MKQENFFSFSLLGGVVESNQSGRKQTVRRENIFYIRLKNMLYPVPKKEKECNNKKNSRPQS